MTATSTSTASILLRNAACPAQAKVAVARPLSRIAAPTSRIVTDAAPRRAGPPWWWLSISPNRKSVHESTAGAPLPGFRHSAAVPRASLELAVQGLRTAHRKTRRLRVWDDRTRGLVFGKRRRCVFLVLGGRAAKQVRQELRFGARCS